MGSLGYLMGGALAGLGKGMETVGAQAEKEQLVQKESDLATARDETHERLRNKLENERIANEQQFRHTETETAATRAATAAGVRQTFEAGEHEKHEAAATGRTKITAGGHVRSAEINAAGHRKPIPEFTSRTLNEQGSIGKDEHGNAIILPGRSYDLMKHRSGQGFVAVGDMYLPYDASQTQFPETKSIGRAPAPAIQALRARPEKMMDFFQKYHYIPRDAVSALQQQKDQQRDASLPSFIPKGTTAGPETGLGGAQESPGDDAAEANADDGGYANYGDAGHQASDDTPAQ
jgi:hypothetical protein